MSSSASAGAMPTSSSVTMAARVSGARMSRISRALSTLRVARSRRASAREGITLQLKQQLYAAHANVEQRVQLRCAERCVLGGALHLDELAGLERNEVHVDVG